MMFTQWNSIFFILIRITLALKWSEREKHLSHKFTSDDNSLIAAQERSLCSVDFFRCNPAFLSQSLKRTDTLPPNLECPFSVFPAGPIRYVISHGFDGLSDSLAGAVTGFYIALFTGSRLLMSYDDGDIKWGSVYRAQSIIFDDDAFLASTGPANTTFLRLSAYSFRR